MKKKINIPLIIITLGIWGFILYSVVQAVWFNIDETKIETEPVFSYNKNNKQYEDIVDFEIEKLNNDPFNSTRIETKEEIFSEVNEQIEPRFIYPPINFSVSGVVINGKSKKIVFNDNTHSNIVFLEEGDIYQNLKVIKILKNQVEFINLDSYKPITSTIQ